MVCDSVCVYGRKRIRQASNLYISIGVFPHRHRCGLDWNQQWMNIVIVLGATVALLLHSHQTESTYRLDFIWKLQATGTPCNTQQSFFNLQIIVEVQVYGSKSQSLCLLPQGTLLQRTQ